MHGASAQSRWQRYASYGACYTAWVVFSVGGFLCLMQVREILVTLAVLAGVAGKPVSVLYGFGLVLVGMACIAGIGALESYLRLGLNAGRLRERIVRVAAVEAGFLGFSYALQWVLQAAATHA